MDAIRKRRSIRKYKTRSVEDEKIDKILEAGRLSPSAANKQPWHFIIVRDIELKNGLKNAYNQNNWSRYKPLLIISIL